MLRVAECSDVEFQRQVALLPGAEGSEELHGRLADDLTGVGWWRVPSRTAGGLVSGEVDLEEDVLDQVSLVVWDHDVQFVEVGDIKLQLLVVFFFNHVLPFSVDRGTGFPAWKLLVGDLFHDDEAKFRGEIHP